MWVAVEDDVEAVVVKEDVVVEPDPDVDVVVDLVVVVGVDVEVVGVDAVVGFVEVVVVDGLCEVDSPGFGLSPQSTLSA